MTSLRQTTSIIRRLRLIVGLVALLFLLDFAGVFVSSRTFLDGMRTIREANTLYDLTTRSADTLPGTAPISRLQPGERDGADLRAVFQSSLNQTAALLDQAITHATHSPEAQKWLSEARQAVESMKAPTDEAFEQVTKNPKALLFEDVRGQILLAGQFELEAREALRKAQRAIKLQGDSLFESIYSRRHVPVLSALALGLLFLTLATLLGLSSAKNLAHSIDNLRRATARVQAGDLKFRAPILRADEIGLLTHSFNQMMAALEQAQERSEAAVQIRDEFLSIASHELKTPLTPLKIQMQSLIRMMKHGKLAALPTPQLEKMIISSDGQIERLTRLVDELLDVSRIGAGRLTFHPERCNLGTVVREVVERFRGEFTASGTDVRLDLEEVTGNWDRFRLEQVLTNLVTNVLRYAPGKPLEIRVRAAGEGAELSMIDHGMGIAAVDQGRIFERFERAAPSRNFGGLGLGLYITRQIVVQHGGDIRVQSVPGEGSTFTVRLPIEPPAGTA